MPNMDSSEYTSRKRLAALHNANRLADVKKFRAPTRFDIYNPHKIGNKGSSLASADVCTTECIILADKSDIFAVKKYAASKVPHFN
jgi:hypothetical protein